MLSERTMVPIYLGWGWRKRPSGNVWRSKYYGVGSKGRSSVFATATLNYDLFYSFYKCLTL